MLLSLTGGALDTDAVSPTAATQSANARDEHHHITASQVTDQHQTVWPDGRKTRNLPEKGAGKFEASLDGLFWLLDVTLRRPTPVSGLEERGSESARLG